MQSRFRFFWFFLFLLIAASACGSFFEVSVHGSGKEMLTQALRDFLSAPQNAPASLGACFLQSLKTTLPPFLLLLAAPVLFPLLLLLPAVVFVKGFAVGFASAMTFEALGSSFSSVCQTALALLPQNLLQIPLLCTLCAYAADTCLMLRSVSAGHKIRTGSRAKTCRDILCRYCFVCLCGLMFYLISFLPAAFLMR